MFEHETLDRFKAEVRDALEAYLDRLTLPSLMGVGQTQPLELTLSAAFKTTGPLPEQTLTLSVSPLQTHKTTALLTSGSARKEPSKLDDIFSPEDLRKIPFLS